MDPIKLETHKVMVCRHNVDNTLKITSERHDDHYTMKVTETICPWCMAELRADALLKR